MENITPNYPLSDNIAQEPELSLSPEVYNGCLLHVLAAATRNDKRSQELVSNMAQPLGDGVIGFVCRKAGCRLMIDEGVLYRTSSCAKVQAGDMEVPVELR